MRKIKSQKKEEAGFLKICIVQTVCVLILAGIIFLTGRVNEALFSEIKNYFYEIMSEDFDIGGYFSSFSDSGQKVSPVMSLNVKPEKEAFCLYDSKGVMPAKGTVTSDFGERIHPVYGTPHFHSGRDIAAEKGSSIYAVFDGTVKQCGNAPMAGNYIRISHSGGRETFYCHLDKIYPGEGEKIRQGDIIGTMGETGLATGSHLHFEYRENGEIKDPVIILKGARDVH